MILVVEALAKVLCPCTLNTPVLVVEAKTLLLDIKLVAEAVPAYNILVTV